MAVPANTVQTFAMVGIREDLSDVITNIDPFDTPFYSMCRKGKAINRTPEWERENLTAPNPDNKVIEGDDVTPDVLGQPERLKNVVQLMDKTISVSTTANAVNAAGKSTEMAHQVMKEGKALKRDMEMRLCGNYASVVGNAATEGELAGAEAWITTNVDRDAGGASGGFQVGTGLVNAATDGATRAITEAMLKNVIHDAWDNGGNPTTVLAGGKIKQDISGFAGIATQYRENSGTRQATILGAADVYVSDFGTHRIVPTRWLGAGTGRTADARGRFAPRTALVLTPNMWEVMFLQPFKTEPLAKTGHNTKRLMSAEFTLKCKEQLANGVVADLA